MYRSTDMRIVSHGKICPQVNRYLGMLGVNPLLPRVTSGQNFVFDFFLPTH